MQQYPLARQSTMKVVVDDREARFAVIKALELRPDVEVVVERLAVGDYVIDGRLVVERKSVLDFAWSVRNGRLFRQAGRLSGSSKSACIVLEGRPDEWRRAPVKAEGVRGALVSLAVVFRLPVLRTRAADETAAVMISASRQLRKQQSVRPRRYGPKTSSSRKCQLLMLQCVPEIGYTRATRLLGEFGNLESLLKASIEELEAIRGIGHQVAWKVWHCLHGT